MLNDEEINGIRTKMKEKHINCATLAVMFGIKTRQSINCVLNKKCKSKKIEDLLRDWLNNKNNIL